MQIILDSNVYIADFRMEGIAFSNLFDLVRKTSSTMVLPRIVREEVVHRYVSRLIARVGDVSKAWKAYRYMMLDGRPSEFRKPAIKYQVREFRKRLKAPAKDIAIQYAPDISGVDLNEVALRGIRRTPPASLEGEELRDVIIWFQVLALAKSTTETTIFITGDSGFWDGDSLKSQIEADIREAKTSIQVHKTIESVIKANSPRQIALTPETATELVPAAMFSEFALAPFSANLKRAARSSMYEFFGAYGGDVEVMKLEPVASRFVSGM